MRINKETITRNFSRYAYTYDKYAGVQQCIASKLLELIGEGNINNILELGCGTGNFTCALRKRFNSARIRAVDISGKMIEVASGKFLPAGRQGKDSGIDFIVQDAEGLNLKESFDLVTSNACFQWFNDLEKALINYKGILNNGGIVLFSIFGPETLSELNVSLKHLFKNASLPSKKFMTKDKLLRLVRKYFRKTQMKEFRYTESFSCLRELLNKIKYTGIRGEGLNGRLFLTPGSLRKLEEVYLNKFAGIRATYQVFLCYGRK